MKTAAKPKITKKPLYVCQRRGVETGYGATPAAAYKDQLRRRQASSDRRRAQDQSRVEVCNLKWELRDATLALQVLQKAAKEYAADASNVKSLQESLRRDRVALADEMAALRAERSRLERESENSKHALRAEIARLQRIIDQSALPTISLQEPVA